MNISPTPRSNPGGVKFNELAEIMNISPTPRSNPKGVKFNMK